MEFEKGEYEVNENNTNVKACIQGDTGTVHVYAVEVTTVSGTAESKLLRVLLNFILCLFVYNYYFRQALSTTV